jgi:hypothetical protein
MPKTFFGRASLLGLCLLVASAAWSLRISGEGGGRRAILRAVLTR